MRAIAQARSAISHDIEVRGHTFVSDEPGPVGGDDLGPTPQELIAGALAACTAITLRMYGERKGWDLNGLEVVADSRPGESGACGRFVVTLRLPDGLSDEQVRRLRVIAGKCPVHRTLASPEVCAIEDRVELVGLSADRPLTRPQERESG
jgi:putative redox protein